jgi:glycosyltransferase involved in cell wall biosynthesis
MNVLYLSYDGLTDPLGQSQILPYLIGLKKFNLNFTVLSFEKKINFEKNKAVIIDKCNSNNINWIPLNYTKNPPILSTIFDLIKLNYKIKSLIKRESFSIIHCRSYIPAILGLKFKKKNQIKFIFDMRGFWADERIDGNIWNKNNFLHNYIFNYFKKKEKDFLIYSDAIVSLTNNGKNEILSWKLIGVNKDKIHVIPCACDYQHFNLTNEVLKTKAKQKINIDSKSIVLSYIGSLGTWYLIDEMLFFFKKMIKKYPNSIFLIITQDNPKLVLSKLINYEIPISCIKIISSTHDFLPSYALASDISIFFIKNSFSKKASSPTKMGELLAMGIPLICNDIGDVKEIIENTKAGKCLSIINEIELENVLKELNSLFKKNPIEIRQNAMVYLDLNIGINNYAKIYNTFV